MNAYPSSWIDGSDMVLVFDDVDAVKLNKLHRETKTLASSVLGVPESELKIILTVEFDEKGGEV